MDPEQFGTEALSESASIALLDPVPRPAQLLTRTVGEATAFAESLGGTVVAKASGVAHKSELDAVRTGLDAAALSLVWAELAGLGDGTVLVAEQVAFDYELIVGALRDPHFGPIAMVGLGGVFAEVHADVTFLRGPVDEAGLGRALRGLRSCALLAGARGKPAIDLHALAGLLTRSLDTLHRHPHVREVECNPVAVSGGVLKVLDALVVVDRDVDGLPEPAATKAG